MSAKQMAILITTTVALVVIVTLVVVGLPGRGGEVDKPKDLPVLTEPHLAFANANNGIVIALPSGLDRSRPLEYEKKTDGHYDFWFKNEKDAAVEIFLTKLSCNRCLTAKAALAPDGWQAAQAAAAVASGGFGAAAQAVAPAPVPGPDVAWTSLDSEEVKSGTRGFPVPPKGAGWVRLGWKDQEAGPQWLSADLRTTSPSGNAPPVHLQVRADFIEPVRVLPEKREADVGTLRRGDRREASFTVYSSTRPAFALEPESDAEKAKHPFVTCGEAVPLTGEECRKLEKARGSAVLCGYRVPVTVRERLGDGREHDLGPFRTAVALTSDVTDDAVALTVVGTVAGDVTVVSGREDLKDRIDFEVFPRSGGDKKTVTVETEPGTALELEEDTVPAFMKADLKAEPQGSGPRKAWSLTVTIPPNAVLGRFGHPDDGALRDTAIYLKAKGRRVRIPVRGTASQN
jgi:hypothetical protein